MTVDLEQLDHVAITVSDVHRSIEWYQDVLGFEKRHPEWGTEPAMMCVGDTCVALFEGAVKQDERRMRHIAFKASREAFAAAQEELAGRSIECEFMDHDTAHSIYFHDPDGHRLEITTYELG